MKKMRERNGIKMEKNRRGDYSGIIFNVNKIVYFAAVVPKA